MTKSFDFIVAELKHLVELLPEAAVRYENHISSKTHFVEILPIEVYKKNETCIAWEENVFFRFIQQFPEENLTFISSDALVGISHADFELEGRLFQDTSLNSINRLDELSIAVILDLKRSNFYEKKVYTNASFSYTNREHSLFYNQVMYHIQEAGIEYISNKTQEKAVPFSKWSDLDELKTLAS